MAKQVDGYLKLQVRGGLANPAPPIGPALGSKGLNIMNFCNQFNTNHAICNKHFITFAQFL